MIINSANLSRAFTGFKTLFNAGQTMAQPMKDRIATTVPSMTRKELYGWLGAVPGFREWIGDRVIHNIATHDWELTNKSYESTLQVDRDEFEDDTFGTYAPLFQQMGLNTAAHPDTLIWPLLKAGFTGLCYDGQYFFDTDHPVGDGQGGTSSVANTDGGGGTPWFLMAGRSVLKPIIWQTRKPYDFVAKDNPNDERVFMNKKFVYGVDARAVAGYGLWQTIWGSKQTLDATYYATARAAIMSMKGDHGQSLGLMPDTLFVPPSLESAGRKLLNSEYGTGGVTNEWKGTAELLVVPWLA